MPTRIMILHLKNYAMRPAIQAFASYLQEAFAAGGAFAPGTIAPPVLDRLRSAGAPSRPSSGSARSAGADGPRAGHRKRSTGGG